MSDGVLFVVDGADVLDGIVGDGCGFEDDDDVDEGHAAIGTMVSDQSKCPNANAPVSRLITCSFEWTLVGVVDFDELECLLFPFVLTFELFDEVWSIADGDGDKDVMPAKL